VDALGGTFHRRFVPGMLQRSPARAAPIRSTSRNAVILGARRV
jgi:hypothetical protein